MLEETVVLIFMMKSPFLTLSRADAPELFEHRLPVGSELEVINQKQIQDEKFIFKSTPKYEMRALY